VKPSPIILTILTLLTIAATASAEGARESRFLILPYLGYQAMDGENVGYAFTARLHHIYFPDSITYISGSGSGERSINAPVFGLAYRYCHNKLFHCELALAIIHDGTTLKYPISYYDEYERSRQCELTVERKNSLLGSLDLVYTLPAPVRWFDIGIRAGGGYAWRRIKVRTSSFAVDGSSDDAKGMILSRAGIDLTFWKDKQLVFQGSLFYIHFIPTNTEVDPFGGLGWRMSFFPIWSSR